MGRGRKGINRIYGKEKGVVKRCDDEGREEEGVEEEISDNEGSGKRRRIVGRGKGMTGEGGRKGRGEERGSLCPAGMVRILTQ